MASEIQHVSTPWGDSRLQAPMRAAATTSSARPSSSRRLRHLTYLALAVALPLLVGAVFPHPDSRLIVPESIMLAIAVLLTLLDGLAAGLVAAVLAPFCLWIFNVQPPFTFEFTYTADITAILTAGAITSGLVVVIDALMRREYRATEQRIRLDDEVDKQRATITTLQNALLPDALPELPGLTIGWRYVPGGGSVSIGGDWLVFVPIGATAVGIAIGDVAGHGLSAVSAMAEYRFAIKVLATQGVAAGEMLGELDTVASKLGERLLSTCIFGVLDVEKATWTYASAGHPPPLCLRDGHTDVLAAPHGPPVGAELWSGHASQETVVALKDDDLVVLYTDGLVERRHSSIDLGITALANRVVLPPDDADLSEECGAIISDLVGASPGDDVAMALLRYRTSP
jgi:hypothetical protein